MPALPAEQRLPRSQRRHRTTWTPQRAHRYRRVGWSMRTPAQPVWAAGRPGQYCLLQADGRRIIKVIGCSVDA